VRQLRARSPFTVTYDFIDEHAETFQCAVCDNTCRDYVPSADGWHVIDAETERPVCGSCIELVDPHGVLRSLARSLDPHTPPKRPGR
jgi:hypothetical protein